MRAMFLGLTTIVITAGLAAQTAPATANPVDVRTGAAIDAQAKTLLAEAQKSPAGIASATLEKYPGHTTMLTVRTKPGGAEMHAEANDIFIAEDGEATVLIGGKIVEAKETSPGETRGSSVEGGTPHPLHKGDVMHISPNVPHQTVVAPGKTFTYYVIKVAVPKS